MRPIPLDINAGNFIDSYRSIGYSMETAIADIIDNSIAANATEIRINMVWEDYEKSRPYVEIIDNGIGMSDSELIEAMRFACKSPLELRDVSDLGRFGLGLKSASFSQCRVFTVVSKRERFSLGCKRWNIDFIKENGFQVLDCTADEVGMSDSLIYEHGTVVRWTDLDQLNIPEEAETSQKDKYWRQIMKRVHDHISITYGSFKNKIELFFNDNPIELWDPFLVDNLGTKVVTDEFIILDGHQIKITTYILPNKLEESELAKATMGKSLSELQGFYLYRSNRLIKYGGWFNLPKMTNREAYRLARIRIDIDNSMDLSWHIDVKKENASFPPAVVDKFLNFAKAARTKSASIFRSKGKTLRRTNSNDLNASFLWSYGVKGTKAFYAINRENPMVKSLLNSLEGSQKDLFEMLIKSLENYIPVQSLIETESKSEGTYVENEASDISDSEIERTFLELIDSMIEDDNCEFFTAAKFLRGMEPFVNHLEIVDKIIKKKEEESAI